MILTGALIAIVIYWAAFLTTSLTSQEQVLELNQEKRFCGFYLDCHLSASVTNVSRMKTLGPLPQPKTAAGLFYVVTVRIRSDAMRARMSFDNPEATVVDARGKQYERSVEAEAAWESAQGRAVPLAQEIEPGGHSYTKDLVFDLPQDIEQPSLLLSKGGRLERLTEMFLVGDEDSWLHKKVKFRLDRSQNIKE
jgi:hypothetical protein